MNDDRPNFLEYLKDADYNFWVTLLRDPDLLHFFKRLDEQMLDAISHLNKNADLTARGYLFYQTAFWIVANRQLRNSFSAAAHRMTYDAMLLIRPGLESVVFAYRIFKDPDLLRVWANKRGDRKSYKHHFRDAEYPPDMPWRNEFKSYINRLNESCAHPNLDYFAATVEFEENVMHINFFDTKSERNFYLNILTILLYGMRILEVMRATLKDRFPVYLTSTEANWSTLQFDFKKLGNTYNKRYNLHQRSA